MGKRKKKNNKSTGSNMNEMTNKKEKRNKGKNKNLDVNGVMEFAEELNPDDFE